MSRIHRPRASLALLLVTPLLLATVGLVPAASAQQGEVLDRRVDAQGQGYSVLRVWGTPHEMGYAQGYLYAQEIAAAIAQFKTLRGESLYTLVKAGVAAARWDVDTAATEEIGGIVAGVKAARPDAVLDEGDIQVANTYGDWGYGQACRSHSTWGSFVAPPIKTLSTRRLDFGSPVDAVKHHLLVSREPTTDSSGGGGIRWVNLQWPGLALAVTAVNEHGTLASLHDYRSDATLGAHLPRSSLVRYALTLVDGLPLDQHLDAVHDKLAAYTISTGTFLNYYVPEGHGGVLTCDSGGKCDKKRVAQKDFFGGEVLLTTNSETDGHSAPTDDSFMEAYYQQGGKKSLDDHFAAMGDGGLHLLSVAYRGRGDMTLWFRGRVSGGNTETVKLEWSSLFKAGSSEPPPPPQPGTDAGVPDAQPVNPGGSNPPGGGTPGDGDDGGCSVAVDLEATVPLPLAGLGLLALLALGGLGRRRRRG